MAHYATDCWDAEIKSSYGWIESVGCADRSAYDLTAHSKRTGEKLIARDTLDEPIIKSRLVLNIEKSKFGPAFKKNSKFVTGYFDSFKLDDGDHDPVRLEAIQKELQANNQIVVTGTDGNTYTVTGDMISVSMETEKINGKSNLRTFLRSLDMVIPWSHLHRFGGYCRGLSHKCATFLNFRLVL